MLVARAKWLIRGEAAHRFRASRTARILLESGLFDQVHYLAQAPDLSPAAPTAVEHYLARAGLGAPEPNPLFDSAYYVKENPDVAACGANPLLHFIEHGAAEGRSPHPEFDTAYYATTYPDVLPSGLNPLRHFLAYGRMQGRFATEFARREAAKGGLRADGTPRPWPPRVVVMDYRVPRPNVSAGERATVGILQDLRQFGFEVLFLPASMEADPAPAEELERLGIVVVTRAEGRRTAADFIRAHGADVFAFYVIRVEVAEAVAEVIRAYAPDARLIFHSPDVHFLRQLREAELKDDPTARAEAEHMREREVAIMRGSDLNVIVSPAELPILRQYLPEAPIAVFPVLYAPVAPEPGGIDGRKDLFFLGGFAHPPNIDAVQWFCAEVWPHVRARLPGARFHIVGSEAPDDVRVLASLPGVAFDGFVEDLEPLLAAMRVGVAPIRFGAGIKGKVALTMGAGVPCVCTTIAAEGMGIVDQRQARVADDAEAFAEAVVELYTDSGLWERLSQRGRALVDRKFSGRANRASLFGVLDAARALPLRLYADYCAELPAGELTIPPCDDGVQVSIIVPVYNQWRVTRACLSAILSTCSGDDVSFELILADDGSSDETIEAGAVYPGLRVVRAETNLGFLRNCNNAAKHARGRYLLFLNNDTVVLPGWLTELHHLIESDPSVAIVGSKLLNLDGTLQEAGAVLWKDGGATNCGRGLPRDQPEFEFAREVDYVSGASMMVRRSFWTEIGGFDERYQNAYCEDSDLAMSARAKGLRVLYQPRSQVIHFEHQSYTGDLGHEPLQRANISRLLGKWGEVFSRDHLPATAPTFVGMAHAERRPSPDCLARRRAGRLNVLYFSPFPSHPSTHGNRSTIQEFVRQFETLGHKVRFVTLRNQVTAESVAQMRSAWRAVDLIDFANPLTGDGEQIPFDGWYEEGLGEKIHTLCALYDIDVVFCSYVFQSRLLDYVPDHILKIIDTHDKMGDRYDLLRSSGHPMEFFSCSPEQEGAYLRRADIVVARRDEEAKYFDLVSGRRSAVVVPHIEPPRFVMRDWPRLSRVGLVASANHVNLAMTKAFVDTLALQAARDGVCRFEVHVAGEVREMVERLPAIERSAFSAPWLTLRGFVPDIEQFYAEMDLIVSPVTVGTGINVKTVQAMAFGMPVLSTLCGAKGVGSRDPAHQYADVEALVSALIALAQTPRELERLAAVSRARYSGFHDEAMAALSDLFRHPKLSG